MAFRPFFLRIAGTLCALSALPIAALHADELKLADGSTIKGTIVGFDDNSFKVQTNYGFALVRKDRVVSIAVTGSANAGAPEKKPEPVVEKTPGAEKAQTVPAAAVTTIPEPTLAPPAIARTSEKTAAPIPPTTVVSKASETPALGAPAAAPASKLGPPPPLSGATAGAPSTPAANAAPAKPPVTASRAQAPSAPSAAAAISVNSTAPAATRAVALPPPAPPKAPAPEPIRETVSGNTYTNNSYRFQMYKPPDWQVLTAARTVLPGAIAALGTDDQQTYLLIGQEPAGKPLYLVAEAADKRLRDVMENFRPQGQEQMLVAGSWSTAHRFRGSVDQHDWSGVVVLVPHGPRLYTIFGMTRADTDLVQIQENVIARAIASLQFSDP